jgi:hypothetical protein
MSSNIEFDELTNVQKIPLIHKKWLSFPPCVYLVSTNSWSLHCEYIDLLFTAELCNAGNANGMSKDEFALFCRKMDELNVRALAFDVLTINETDEIKTGAWFACFQRAMASQK